MKLTMELTLDGLIRALRAKEHGLAEDREEEHRRATIRRNKTALSLLASETRRLALEAGDEFGG